MKDNYSTELRTKLFETNLDHVTTVLTTDQHSSVLPTTTGRDRCRPCTWSTRDFTCALVSFPDQRLWHLTWEGDYMCASVQNLKMASFATDSSLRVLWMAFINQGEFEAMSGWEAACCDEYQFRAKIKLNTWAVFELSLFDKWSEQRKKDEKWHFC